MNHLIVCDNQLYIESEPITIDGINEPIVMAYTSRFRYKKNRYYVIITETTKYKINAGNHNIIKRKPINVPVGCHTVGREIRAILTDNPATNEQLKNDALQYNLSHFDHYDWENDSILMTSEIVPLNSRFYINTTYINQTQNTIIAIVLNRMSSKYHPTHLHSAMLIDHINIVYCDPTKVIYCSNGETILFEFSTHTFENSNGETILFEFSTHTITKLDLIFRRATKSARN